MTAVRNWLLAVTCAALVVAVADCLMPEGTVKKLGRVTGGLLLMLTVIRPLVGLDYSALAMVLTEYRLEETAVQTGQDLGADQLEAVIVRQTEAYIRDKAASMGIHCEVEVECREGDGGIPYPAVAKIEGNLSQTQQRALSLMIEGELAVPANCQIYTVGKGEN